MPGTLGTLHAGVRALNDTFIAAAPDRDTVLYPVFPSDVLALLLADESEAAAPATSPPVRPTPPE
jgi:hypothetical protein